MYKPGYKILLLVTIVAAIGGVLTLIPRKAASWDNVMGYRSICTFAPAAPLFCFFIAGTSCFIRAAFVKDGEGSKKDKFKRHKKSLAPLAFVLILAAGSTIWFAGVKARYSDAASAGADSVTSATG